MVWGYNTTPFPCHLIKTNGINVINEELRRYTNLISLAETSLGEASSNNYPSFFSEEDYTSTKIIQTTFKIFLKQTRPWGCQDFYHNIHKFREKRKLHQGGAWRQQWHPKVQWTILQIKLIINTPKNKR